MDQSFFSAVFHDVRHARFEVCWHHHLDEDGGDITSISLITHHGTGLASETHGTRIIGNKLKSTLAHGAPPSSSCGEG